MAEELGPGSYYGYYAIDRWGQHVFYSVTSHLFLSEKVAQQLKSYQGKFLKVDVKDMYQPRNPGGGIIEEISKVSIVKEFDITLEASAAMRLVKQGQGIKFHLTVRNVSNKPIKLTPWDLSIALVTDKPLSNSAIGYKDPEDRAYWYYQESVHSKEKPETLLQVACHEIQFPWHPEEYAANGQGVIVGPQTPTHMTPGIYYPLIIKPSGKFEADIMVGQELLPGQYEAYFYQKNSPFEKQGLVSKRVSFDVLESDFK